MPGGQRPTARHHPRYTVTDGFEFPDTANLLEVTNVQASVGTDLANTGADEVKQKRVHAVISPPDPLLRYDANHLQTLVRVTPFVVVPGDDFDEGAVKRY